MTILIIHCPILNASIAKLHEIIIFYSIYLTYTHTTVMIVLIMLDLVEKSVSKISQVEKFCHDYFNIDLQIDKIILNNMPTSHNSHTTVFTANHHAVYAFCRSDEQINLADIKKIIKQMGMKAEKYLPPEADEDYFLRYGQNVFQSVFPGRKSDSNDETLFYQTLTPYNPALVRIGKVNGEIRQYNSIGNQWQPAIEFSYLRMQVR